MDIEVIEDREEIEDIEDIRNTIIPEENTNLEVLADQKIMSNYKYKEYN